MRGGHAKKLVEAYECAEDILAQAGLQKESASLEKLTAACAHYVGMRNGLGWCQ